MNQKIHNHKMMYVNKVHEIMTQGGAQAQLLLKRCSTYSETCTKIVTEMLQNSGGFVGGGPVERFKDFENALAVPLTTEDSQDKYYERMTLMLRFIKGYYDFKYWNSLEIAKRFEHLQMDQLSLFHWILFYNDHQLLEHIITKTPVGDKIHLISTLTGDHQPLDYVLTSGIEKKEMGTLRFEKVGLLLAMIRKSFQCLKILLVPKI